MLEAVPYVPIANQVRIGIAIFSYDGAFTFGVTGDLDTAPDIEVLCSGIESGMSELVAAAGGAETGPAASASAAKPETESGEAPERVS